MKKRGDFLSIPRDQSIHCRGFVFSYDLDDSGEVLVGFTASKKVGNAVFRARAKRRMRAIVDELMRLNSEFNCSGGRFVLIARRHIFDCDHVKMVKDLAGCLAQVRGDV